MADIDKALPNEVRKEFELPSGEEIQEQVIEETEAQEESLGPVDIQENEDGSVDINLDPQAATTPGMQRILNLGMSPKMAMRAARIASPLGIASLGGEALYQYGKFAKDEIKKVKAMNPDERKAYNEALMDEGGLFE